MNEIGRRITDKLIELHGSTNFSIAFLPYKRSMWNSMASVYEECKASGIDAHCYPIPYYCMNNKGNGISCTVYEGGLFENMAEPVEEFKGADYIVIHYPYDDHNKVTNMLPEYHIMKLKKRGEVVYIPYACSNQRFLRIQPGLANIDYAFLSTEAEAEAFIREWNEYGVDFSGRIFGYGSPKMDAIANIKHHENECFTTLVINSLGPFLSAPFEKIRLYQHHITNEIGAGHQVIFRPHPLLRTTIKSMRPDTMAAYEKFIAWCETRDHVEVDDTEYLEEALSKADYLISDPSSVTEMWISTGREYKII